MEGKSQAFRNRNILEMVGGLLLSEIAFQEIFNKYKKGQLRFSDIGSWVDDKGQSLLFNLKEKCHFLFRNREIDFSHKKEWLLDLAIGSIFHEAMKLRENIYQLEVYRPKYLQYRSKAGRSPYEADYLHQFERIISKAEQGILDGMEETRSLFQDALAQLVDFFKDNSKNQFLIRFLLEHQSVLQRVYGPKGTKEIFNGMFKKGFFDACLRTARSYLQSGHYDLSSLYFSKALKLSPRHRDLQFLLNFSLGMNAYYNNAYQKALSHFSKLPQSRLIVKGKRALLKKVEDVCHRISLEWEEEKRLKSFKKALFLVNRIKKCYS